MKYIIDIDVREEGNDNIVNRQYSITEGEVYNIKYADKIADMIETLKSSKEEKF